MRQWRYILWTINVHCVETEGVYAKQMYKVKLNLVKINVAAKIKSELKEWLILFIT